MSQMRHSAAILQKGLHVGKAQRSAQQTIKPASSKMTAEPQTAAVMAAAAACCSLSGRKAQRY
jgi:hypothetical protein